MEISGPVSGAMSSGAGSPVSQVGAALFSRFSRSRARCFSTSARVGWNSCCWKGISAGGNAAIVCGRTGEDESGVAREGVGMGMVVGLGVGTGEAGVFVRGGAPG